MLEFNPYKIIHINLEDSGLAIPDSINSEKWKYVVFWWGQVAIGDAYITPHKNLDLDYTQLLLKSITPAVTYYTELKKQGNTINWKSLLLQQKESRWIEFMQVIFGSETPRKIPPSVPVSVVICTRNRPTQLKRCLEMLEGLTCLAKEIIVIDNAPDDKSTFEIAKRFSNVEYKLEPRAGLDIARNTGVKSANQPIITFIDDDVIVHPLFIYRVWQTFEDPSVDAMTGLVIASDLETKAQVLFEKYCSFNRGYKDIYYDKLFFKSSLDSGPPVWEIGAGANMAFRKDVFDSVGLFDERLDVGAAGCSGDSEMWYRILADNQCIHYNPRAIVYHEHRKGMDSLQIQLYSYMRGHAAAALIQHNFKQPAKYKKRIFFDLPSYYFKLMVKGFPKYNKRYQTIGAEFKGLLSGILFYFQNRNKSAQSD